MQCSKTHTQQADTHAHTHQSPQSCSERVTSPLSHMLHLYTDSSHGSAYMNIQPGKGAGRAETSDGENKTHMLTHREESETWNMWDIGI